MADFSQFYKSFGIEIVLQTSSFTVKPGDKGARASTAACLTSHTVYYTPRGDEKGFFSAAGLWGTRCFCVIHTREELNGELQWI